MCSSTHRSSFFYCGSAMIPTLGLFTTIDILTQLMVLPIYRITYLSWGILDFKGYLQGMYHFARSGGNSRGLDVDQRPLDQARISSSCQPSLIR